MLQTDITELYPMLLPTFMVDICFKVPFNLLAVFNKGLSQYTHTYVIWIRHERVADKLRVGYVVKADCTGEPTHGELGYYTVLLKTGQT